MTGPDRLIPDGIYLPALPEPKEHKPMLSLIGREPVRAAILALIGAVIAVLVAFGVDLTSGQIAALTGLAIAALGIGEAVRANVTPTPNLPQPVEAQLVAAEPVLTHQEIAEAVATKVAEVLRADNRTRARKTAAKKTAAKKASARRN